jgi:hypothetical protein
MDNTITLILRWTLSEIYFIYTSFRELIQLPFSGVISQHIMHVKFTSDIGQCPIQYWHYKPTINRDIREKLKCASALCQWWSSVLALLNNLVLLPEG